MKDLLITFPISRSITGLREFWRFVVVFGYCCGWGTSSGMANLGMETLYSRKRSSDDEVT